MDYDYFKAMKDDIFEYLEETDERNFDTLYEQLWLEDTVTGNGSGSYTFNAYKAEENLCHNLDLLKEALDEFGGDFSEALNKGPEYCDVTIRCYLLSAVLTKVLKELEN